MTNSKDTRTWLEKLADPNSAIRAVLLNIVAGAVWVPLYWLLSNLPEVRRALWNSYVSGRPLWIWLGLFWLSILAASGTLGLLWSPGMFGRMQGMWRDNQARFISCAIATLATGVAPLLIAVMLADGRANLDARVLFPDETEIGPLTFGTYGTDGAASYRVHHQSDGHSNSPQAYAAVTFEPDGDTVDVNCGWVVYFARGFDLSDYSALRVLVRGGRGGEKLVVKAKDIHGREHAKRLDNYVLSKQITTDWAEAVIPFQDFGKVDFSSVDNFSLATNGNLSDVPQTIFVGQFRLTR